VIIFNYSVKTVNTTLLMVFTATYFDSTLSSPSYTIIKTHKTP